MARDSESARILRDLHEAEIRFARILRANLKPLILVLALVMVLFMATQASSTIISSKTISSVGSIKTIGASVYFDSVLNKSVTAIDSGVLDPGTVKDVIVYVRNDGNSAVTLTMSTVSWSPSSASNYLALTWNYGGQSISQSGVTQVKFSLTVAASAATLTDFNFDINLIENS